MADHLAVLNMPMEALKRSATVTSFDPLTLLPALAMVTEHLGLIATASTTFEPAYTIARRFASLDHISGGRAGWNMVTTSNPDAALNFGMDEHMEHAERYARAREFFDVVTGLWDSVGRRRLHPRRRQRPLFRSRQAACAEPQGQVSEGARARSTSRGPIQGWPVIVQAGASDAGRQLAAETAEVVFAAGGPIEAGRAFYADVKGRAAKIGRNPDHIKILPGAFTIIGDSLDEAKEKRARLDSLVSYDSGIAALSIAVGQDARKFDPDGPLPEIPETNQSKSGRERVVALAKRENLTVRQIAGRLGGYGGLAMMGTPKMIADQMEEWLVTERQRRLQRHVPLSAGRARRFRRQGRARAAAPRHLPPRVRGQDLARKSRPAAAGEPLLPRPQPRRRSRNAYFPRPVIGKSMALPIAA